MKRSLLAIALVGIIAAPLAALANDADCVNTTCYPTDTGPTAVGDYTFDGKQDTLVFSKLRQTYDCTFSEPKGDAPLNYELDNPYAVSEQLSDGITLHDISNKSVLKVSQPSNLGVNPDEHYQLKCIPAN